MRMKLDWSLISRVGGGVNENNKVRQLFLSSSSQIKLSIHLLNIHKGYFSILTPQSLPYLYSKILMAFKVTLLFKMVNKILNPS